MTRGHGWSLTITMRGTFTPYSLPAFTGAFDLTPYLWDLFSVLIFEASYETAIY